MSEIETSGASDAIETVVRQVLRDILGLSEAQVAGFERDTELFGALPELDSMAVAGLLTEMEDRLGILIEDDGPGIPEPTRDMALQRGMRLDERLPGSGLGLAIVEELVALYQGRFQLDASEHGGLAAVVWLPEHPLPQPADRHGHTKGG